MSNTDKIETNLSTLPPAEATNVLAMMEIAENLSKLNITLQSIEEHMRYAR